ncbi:hypothetical protein SAMN05444483_10371 [Salegentibacter echinorum]|uniref:Uncharacterized protein n=1 Tax=Salegentibacter echinorum TaxID=1073325 RepID=A0A1M5F8D7_SALEC|nr:hypothetical protein [Salegentibacter echinorum]SHF87785.1 hypothetical protein SAMN05444483_10371 [Salegentibacter echinorum]
MKKPKKCISVEEARREQDEWVKTRGKDIEKCCGYEDTREFWYSLDELQEYLDYVREKSKEQDVEKPGIRFYLGAYPKTKGKRSYTTMFLSPTKEKSRKLRKLNYKNDGDDNENNYDIEPMNIIQGGEPPRNY